MTVLLTAWVLLGVLVMVYVFLLPPSARHISLFVHFLLLGIALVLGFYHVQEETIEYPYLEAILRGVGFWFAIELVLQVGPALLQFLREIIALQQGKRYGLLLLALVALIYLRGMMAEISRPWTLWYEAIDYERGSTEWKGLYVFKTAEDCNDAKGKLAVDELKKRLKAQADKRDISKQIFRGESESIRALVGKSLIVGIGHSVIEFQMPSPAIPSIIGPWPWRKRAWSHVCTRGLKYGFLPYGNYPKWDPADRDLLSWGLHEVEAKVAKLAEQDTYSYEEAFIAAPSLEKMLERLESGRKAKEKKENKEKR